MFYEMIELSNQLLFIRWHRLPGENTHAEKDFVGDLRQRLHTAQKPLYFISDLRQGRIVNVIILKNLGALTAHENWGGSTAFSNDPLTSVFVNVFTNFSSHPKAAKEVYDTPEEALAYLESIKPGLTKGIPWESLIIKGVQS